MARYHKKPVIVEATDGLVTYEGLVTEMQEQKKTIG